MHQSYSSSVSPFQAKTGMPAAAIAAAAWSWVEKMLHELQRTLAPRCTSVSIKTAVWIVMCRQPTMRAPGERLRRAELLAQRHQPGHLGFGDRDLAPPPAGKRDIGNLVIGKLGHPQNS